MKRIVQSVFRFLLLLILISCIEEIDFSSDGEVEIPFVDGFITNSDEFQTITVGKLIPFSSYSNPHISGVNMYVEDSKGTVYEFNEVGEKYISKDKFAAQNDEEYRLHLTIDGVKYTSSAQTLVEGQEIQNFKYREDSTTVIGFDGEPNEVFGVSLSTDMNNTSGERKYYKYNVDYTYIFEAYRRAETHPYRRCYNTYSGPKYYLHENIGTDYSFDISFYEFGREFEYLLSYNLTQTSMNKEAYDFWTQVNSQGEHTGSIFDTPPYTIRGNIRAEDPDNQIRGFFGIYTIKEQRMFLSQDDVSFEYDDVINQLECYPPRPGWPQRHCFDCRDNQFASEKTNSKPSWWP